MLLRPALQGVELGAEELGAAAGADGAGSEAGAAGADSVLAAVGFVSAEADSEPGSELDSVLLVA